MAGEPLASWQSREYATQWASEDVIAAMLELPRQISTALADELGVDVRHVIDLGSGPGAYLQAFLNTFPAARGTWVDSSDAMLELGQGALAEFGDRVDYLVADVEDVRSLGRPPADVVVTSRVLHHLSHDTVARLYGDVHQQLAPGGLFFNLDHVGVPDEWKPAYRRVRERMTGKRTQPLERHRHDHPFAAPDEHLAWLRAAGFDAPDVPWRTGYTALIAARRGP